MIEHAFRLENQLVGALPEDGDMGGPIRSDVMNTCIIHHV